MSTREPARLTDPAAGAEAELAAALRAWRGEHGSEADVRALRERLGPELAAPSVAGSALTKLLWTKLLLGGLAVLAPLALGWLLFAQRAQPMHGQATTIPHAPASPLVSAPSAPPHRPPEPSADAQARPAAAAASQAARPALRARLARVQPASAPAPERELALLQRAQAALDRSPASVLALTAEHERDHPHGVFAQEREVLAIEALLKLGRRQAAHARAERFVQRFVGSPHTRRVRALLERMPASNAETSARSADDSATNVEP